jgi:hypothetical protein
MGMIRNTQSNHRHDTTPVIAQVKWVAIGEMLDELQQRLARLRRQTEVYPVTQPAVRKVSKQ